MNLEKSVFHFKPRKKHRIKVVSPLSNKEILFDSYIIDIDQLLLKNSSKNIDHSFV